MRRRVHATIPHRIIMVSICSLLPLLGFVGGVWYAKTALYVSSMNRAYIQDAMKVQSPSPCPCSVPGHPPRGFTISVEELIRDEATDPSIVNIKRGEYEIPQLHSAVRKKIAGNKFVLAGENFANPKIKNAGNYLHSLGFDPDQKIPIVEGPGYTQIGYVVSHGRLRRMIIYEGSPLQLTVFLSDPFIVEE